jgi:hypothetical protein
LIPEADVRLCVIADGAGWIWKQARALFRSAVEMLDDSYGREPRDKVAALQYGTLPERQRAWCEAALARLFDGEVHRGIWGLQRMKPTDAQAAREIDKLIRYLQQHRSDWPPALPAREATPWGAGESNRPTRASAMSASSGRGPGGM